ncbi:MAG TPA: aromatic amino acid transport family protein [Candidatus Nanoarchaeia archaeon]|nr:aromatic amino acid transport family protein [Candidatus Nanoarchaeia archaeon]
MDGVTKKFWAAAFTLTGTVIGAGILGLPYVFSKSGFYVGLFWLLFLGSIIILCKLYLGEVILRTKGIHQLPGYAEKYLGKWGRRVMIFEMVFGIYSALLAYLFGTGQSLSQLFLNVGDYAVYFAIVAWIAVTILLREGLRGLKSIMSWGSIAILIVISVIFIWYSPSINIENVSYVNFDYLFLPMGVVLFALLGFSAIPEIKMELIGNERLMKKAIFVGALIPVIAYILFSFIFVAVLGANVPQVATLAFGKMVIILGILTMVTSYFVLSFVLKDMFRYDFMYSRKRTFILVSVIPLLIYFIVYFFNLLSFTSILGIAGVISAGVTGILIVFMNYRAKKLGKRKPEYSIPINWLIIAIVAIVFIFGVLFELGVINFVYSLFQ